MLKPVTILGFCQSPVSGGLIYTVDTGARDNLDPTKGPWGVELEISTWAKTLRDLTLN